MVEIRDVALILFAIILINYANLIYYNTGDTVAIQWGNQPTDLDFRYTVPLSSAIASSFLYLLAIVTMLMVGRKNSVSVLLITGASLILLITGSIFYGAVFKEPGVHLRIQGGKTDSYVLQYESAKALINGKNPYELDFADRIRKDVPVYFRTYIYDGSDILGEVTRLDYPAFSFLWYLPSALMGVEGVWQDLFVLVLLGVLLFIATPRESKYFVPFMFVVSWDYLFYTVGYITDVAWVFLLVLTLISSSLTLSAIALGLAMSYKAEAILFATFFLIYVYRTQGIEKLKRFTRDIAITVLAVNAPFVLPDPSTFLNSVLIPVTGNLAVSGVGLSGLLASAGITVSRLVYSLLVIGVWLATLAIYHKMFEWFKYSGLAVFPLIVMWFNSRSLQNYLMWWPVILLASNPSVELNFDLIASTLSSKIKKLRRGVKV